MADSVDCDSKNALDTEFDLNIARLEYKTCYYPSEEKAVVTEWITKLKNSNETMDERRIRNDVTRYLADLACNKEKFPKPFTEVPIKTKNNLLSEMVKQFPRNMPILCPTDMTRNYVLEMFNNSPDHGQFLANQPVPKHGVFYFFILKKASS